MSELSAKQRQILEYMKAEVREKGYPPSVREICDAVGLKSTSTVHGHLSRLEKKGLIRRDPTLEIHLLPLMRILMCILVFMELIILNIKWGI